MLMQMLLMWVMRILIRIISMGIPIMLIHVPVQLFFKEDGKWQTGSTGNIGTGTVKNGYIIYVFFLFFACK